MWMLYGGDFGKTGAMLDFTPAIIKELLNTPSIDLGAFESCEFVPHKTLNRGQFRIQLTDVVYAQSNKEDSKIRLTLGEDHWTVDQRVLDGSNIYVKHYAWAYERECRMIITRTDMGKYEKKDTLSVARINLSPASRRRLMDNLYRSPVYSGDAVVSKPSVLFGEVDWPHH